MPGMGKRYTSIAPEHRAFIEQQPMYFVASAPLAGSGHVNVSPKGLDTLRIVDANKVMYLDLTGSGNETASHVHENQRLTLMFCAFQGQPKILRLYCRAHVLTRHSLQWAEALARFPAYPGVRQIIVGDVHTVQSSCGFAVPTMTFTAQRDQLTRWADAKGVDGLVEYRRMRNAISLDGLPAPAPDPTA
jgi:hypothetical protein